ncbi:hypothetical protein C1Y63_06645 [Corynebacterium sp. 13CS0277]|nr:PH domain-containing protein [Corynebacterium sp. 13CS0277]PRQ11400.1 hypothetical protein C1Y63_06645 [Corynebacterium sp. 13CS0277]
MHPVSPQLATARFITRLSWIAVLGVVGVVLMWLFGWFDQGWQGMGTGRTVGATAFLVGVVGLFAWQVWLIPRQVANLAYFEDTDEFLITKGRLWHTFTVVPYGRIQFVDVTAGPIARAFGLKTVELHTASSTSDSTIQGLPAEEADALRDRLAAKARERMSGL